MKKIMFFTHEKAYGGASRALITLIDDLIDLYDIYVVVPFKKAKIVRELKKRNVKIIYWFYSWWQVPTNLGFVGKWMYKFLYLFSRLTYFPLLHKIKKLNIDIIHSNTSVIDIGARIAKRINIPHIWHFREFTSIHLDFILGKKRSYRFINNSSSDIIYISKAIRDYYSQFIDSCNTILVYDGVKKQTLSKRKYKREKNIQFLLMGTLEKNKGQDIAIDAIYNVVKNGVTNIKLILAGGDPLKFSEYLNEKIKKYHLEKYVEYIGFVEDPNTFRKTVDVELMCSPNEAFGLVTVEAMLAGNPVIGSNSGATPEIILDNVTGCLYEKNNSVDLASKIEYLVKNPELICQYGENAYKRANQCFLSKRNSEEIIKIYCCILGGKDDLFKNQR